jgi:hypothetical protein
MGDVRRLHPALDAHPIAGDCPIGAAHEMDGRPAPDAVPRADEGFLHSRDIPSVAVQQDDPLEAGVQEAAEQGHQQIDVGGVRHAHRPREGEVVLAGAEPYGRGEDDPTATPALEPLGDLLGDPPVDLQW